MSRFPWQGLRIRVHPLFWLIILSAVWTGYFIEIITLFVLIFVHEMGHITAAWSYGWRIHSMELLPFGGVAKIEEWGTVSAKEEIVVALAGPFYHVFIGLFSLFLFYAGLWTESWTEYFIKGNLMIACFNLLPIYPLDGGRVVQALFSYLLPYRQCVTITLWCSLILSTVLLLSTLIFLPLKIPIPLILIALFLMVSNIMALKQKRFQFLRFLIQRYHRGISHDVKIKKVRVKESDCISKVINQWMKEKYHVIEIIDSRGKCINYLPEERILEFYFSKPHFHSMMKELIS